MHLPGCSHIMDSLLKELHYQWYGGEVVVCLDLLVLTLWKCGGKLHYNIT